MAISRKGVKMANVIDHFTEEELRCKGSGGMAFHTDFLEYLDALRAAYDNPMKVNSCCRSKEYNASIRGHHRSLHVYDVPNRGATGTSAIDIARPDGTLLAKLIHLALERGWSVGWYKTFIHLDRRIDLGMERRIFEP